MAIFEHSRCLDVIIEDLNALGAYLRYSTLAPSEIPHAVVWIAPSDFHHPTSQTQQRFLQAIQANGYGHCKKSMAAAVLLRFGWSAGLHIGAWLTHKTVLLGLQQQVAMNPDLGLVSGIAVQHYTDMRQGANQDALRQQLADELVAHSRPVVDAYHHWSGLSKTALWSMVCSGWASQFITLCEKLNRPEQAIAEAQSVFSRHSIIRHVQPTLYAVHDEHRVSICQKRHLCCLWFKSPARNFCSSCPILPTEERLQQNQRWLQANRLAHFSAKDTPTPLMQ